MAVRFKAKATASLGSSIQRSISSVRAVVRNQWVTKQNQLFELTQSEGVGYEEQIKFMKKWLAEMQTAPFVDSDMINQVKKEISSARGLKKWERYRNKYFESYDALKAGKMSWDQHISDLQNIYGSTNDPNLRKDIQAKLSSAKEQSRNSYNTIIDNRVILAQNDKTRGLVESTMADVKSERISALLGGDNERVSVLDIKLQLLQNTLNIADAEDTMHLMDNMGLDGKNPIQKLKLLKGKWLDSVDDNVPFTYSGVRYNSQREFWKSALGNYVTGTFNDEVVNYYKNKNINFISTFGNKDYNAIPQSMLEGDVKDMDGLINDPVLSDYIVPLTRTAQVVKSDSAAAFWNDASSEYTAEQTMATGRALLAKITNSEALTGINFEGTKVQLKAELGASELQTSASIAQAVQELKASNPGMSDEKAWEIVSKGTQVPDVGLSETVEKGVVQTSKDIIGAPTVADMENPGFNKEQLNMAYQKLLGRDVDPTGLQDFGSSQWAGKTPADLEAAIINSDEYRTRQQSVNQPVTQPSTPTPNTTPAVAPVGDFDMNANTLYNFYKSKLPTLQERAQKFNEFGLGDTSAYVGTSAQNTQLLSKLKEI